MVRLKDIAEAAGVSIMTVSKVLRDAPDISSATKARVRELAARMGYVPNSIAQGLRNRNSKLLGLVISAATNPIFARTIMAIEERAFQTGYELVLAHTLNLPEREEHVIRRLLARRVEGLFITPVHRLAPAAPIYEELSRRGTPTVILGHCAPFCRNFPNIETDDRSGSDSATKHLLALGHRRIAFFAGSNAVPSSQERLEGYRRALREARIEVDDQLIFTAGTTLEDGQAAATMFLEEAPEATAIQAVNDLVAIGAATVLLNSGISIPADLSLVGFGNILLSEHFRIPLTTVRQPKYRLGMAAMETMLQLVRGQPAESKRLPAQLAIRQSTAAPKPASRSAPST